MLRSPRPSSCLGAALIVVGLSACGSSSNSTSLSNASAITSPAERALFVKEFAGAKDIPAADKGPIIDCVIAGLEAHGIRTHGQAEQAKNLPLAQQLGASCARKVLGVSTGTSTSTTTTGSGTGSSSTPTSSSTATSTGTGTSTSSATSTSNTGTGG
ncbi:MAG: hypothetical protein ACYDHH_17185 [Solirubrobacteraceae bacterium]